MNARQRFWELRAHLSEAEKEAIRERGRVWQRASWRAWYANNRERARAGLRASYAKHRERWRAHPEGRMLWDARWRAKRLKVPFSISKSDIVIPKRCPVLGIPIKRGNGRLCDNSPSIDRLINRKGYVPSNINVISMRANHLKGNRSPSELRTLAAKTKNKKLARDYIKIADWLETKLKLIPSSRASHHRRGRLQPTGEPGGKTVGGSGRRLSLRLRDRACEPPLHDDSGRRSILRRPYPFHEGAR